MPADLERPAHLGQAPLAGELLGERRRPARVAVEDAVPVAVERPRQTEGCGGLGQGDQVASAVLLLSEGAAGDPAGGIVDGAHERGEGPVGAEPAVLAAIDLQQLALARCPLPAAPVAGRPVWPGRWPAGLIEDPPQRPLLDVDVLLTLQRLREVRPVDILVLLPGELGDAVPDVRVRAVRGRAAMVAMDQARRAVRKPAREEPAHLAGRHGEHRGCGLEVDRAVAQVRQDIHTPADPGVAKWIIGRSFHAPDRDKVAVRTSRTESPSDDSDTHPR